jgi:hypothetical protein
MYYFSFDGKDGIMLRELKDESYCEKLKSIEMAFLACLTNSLPPPLSDADWIEIIDPRANEVANSLTSLNEQIKKLEIKRKKLYEQLDSILPHTRNVSGNVKLQKIYRPGQVQWQKIPGVDKILQAVNLDEYRGAGSCYWRVTEHEAKAERAD